MVFGYHDTKIPARYSSGKYDFVVVPSMINNNGFDQKVFLDLIGTVRVGGFVIFATKLNYFKHDIYTDEIQ